MRAAVLKLLPRHNAKRWKSALELKRSDPVLNRRSLYAVLNWMRLRGLVDCRENAITGLHEYAKLPKAKP